MWRFTLQSQRCPFCIVSNYDRWCVTFVFVTDRSIALTSNDRLVTTLDDDLDISLRHPHCLETCGIVSHRNRVHIRSNLFKYTIMSYDTRPM